MTSLSLLLATTAPVTLTWSPKVAVVMVICNLLAIIFASRTVKYPKVGPKLPADGLIGGLSIPALIGSTSFGHILGAGAILGLANLGVL